MPPSEADSGKHLLSDQLLTLFHQSNQLAYLTLSADLTISSISPNLGSILPQDNLTDFVERPLTDLFGEFVGAEAEITAVQSGSRPFYRLENLARQINDDFCYVTVQLLLLDSENLPAGFLLIVENSTEIGRLQQSLTQQRNELKHEVARRKKAEDALQKLNDELEQRVKDRTAELAKANEQLRLLEAAIVNTSDTVIITESKPQDLANAGIVYVNKAFTKATGYSYKEIVGQSRQVFHGPNTDPRQLEKIRQALLNQEAIHVEMVNYRKDGSEFWVDMTVAPIINKNNELTHFVSIERDATERKQLETALLQAQKMEAVGLLAGGIAHDFNNVLTVIISYSDLLLRYFNEEEKIRKYVEPIYTAGKRASELTYQLLAFSRQQMLKPEEVNLNQVIMEVETMIRRPIGEDIQFTTLLTPELWSIEADPGQLSQVIMNLAVNARDAMPQGGTLTIETENIVLEKKDSRISPELGTGEFIKLTVSDTGRGMDSDTVKRIFDPFFTTKEAGKGTGLGLSTVYGIVAQSNGGIIVHSEISDGTRFEIFLPRIYQGDKTKNTKSEIAPQQRPGNEIILLVEDDDNVRDLLHQGLKDQGYKMLVASGGEEAIKLCRRHAGTIDLLLIDVVMPDISGPELAQHLHPFFPKMKVLYMTGYTDAVIARHGLDDAAIDLLQKPFTIGTLAGKVRQLFTNPPKKDNPPPPLTTAP